MTGCDFCDFVTAPAQSQGKNSKIANTLLSNIQQSPHHLWAFARDVGLDYFPDGRMYIKDLWKHPENDDSNLSEETKQSSEFDRRNSESERNNSKLGVDWVRYLGQVWQVASQDNGILKLRQSGFRKVIHTVHVSQVEIGGYKE